MSLYERDVVAAVVRDPDTFYFQFRNGERQVGSLGMLGFFGGFKQPEEDPRAAIARKVTNETTLAPHPQEFTYLGSLTVTDRVMDRFGTVRNTQLNTDVFQLLLKLGERIWAQEGQGDMVVVKTRDLEEYVPRMSLLARTFVEKEYLGE